MASSTDDKERYLYVMHVDWAWIKQRPQYLAEGLAAEAKVLVVYPWDSNRRALSGNESPVRRVPFVYVPLRRAPLMRSLDKAIQRAWLQILAWRVRPTILWISHPLMLKYVPDRLRRCRIVYDCMDDALGFQGSDEAKSEIAAAERALVEAAEVVLCSASHLQGLIAKRYGASAKTVVVRNGLADAWISSRGASSPAVRQSEAGPSIDVAYVGTISEWLDLGLLMNAIEEVPSLRIHLIGPTDRRDLPAHERLVLHGPIPHARLREHLAPFDAFVMPFKVTPLVEGVDPVKLYEYVSTGKPTLSVRYSEIERFEDYVHFYEDGAEFVAILRRLADGKLAPKAPPEKVDHFLASSAWSSRVREARRALRLI